MAVISNPSGFMTLVDVAQMSEGVDMINIIARDDGDVASDVVFAQANDGDFGYRYSQTTYIPIPGTRRFNEGFTADKSRSLDQRAEAMSRSLCLPVDRTLLNNKSMAAERFLRERDAFGIGFRQKFAKDLFYGDGTNLEWPGLANIYNSTSKELKDNIVREGNTQPDNADNSSIWIIRHSSDGFHAFYPPKFGNSGAKFYTVDGESVDSNNGGKFPTRTMYAEWYYGFALKNWTHVVRIQFNAEDLTPGGATGANLVDLIKKGKNRLRGMGGKVYGYCSPSVFEMIDLQYGRYPSLGLSTQQGSDSIAADRIVSISGIPIKRCEALVDSETGVA